MTDRFENINLLRAFAATAVVVYHVITQMKWTAFPVAGPLVVYRMGWIGVDLFFVISGFVITRSALALWRQDSAAFRRNYWARRLSRILPLYLLTCALWIVLIRPDLFEPPATRLLFQVASHLTFTHTFWKITYGSINGVNWTIGIEMQFYLAIALLIPWIARTSPWRIWLATILIAWAWRAATYMLNSDLDPTRLFMRLTQLPGVLHEFGAGIFLARWLDRRTTRRPIAGWIWAAAAIGIGYICFSIFWRYDYWDSPGMIVFWHTVLAAFFLCVVAAAVELPSIAETWPLRPLRYLGETSYGIYLWHLFALQACLQIADLQPLQALGITLALTVFLAAMSWHFFERPILAFGRRYSDRPAAQPRGAAG